MPQTSNQKFKITVPITRCYLRKTADGTEKYVIEGMASNTDLDLTGERMAETAILSMAKSLESHPVLFKNEHGDEWDAEFGEVTALYATANHELMMEAELDPDHYRTKTLVKALEKGKQLGLSVGGYVLESGYEWLSDVGRKVKTYLDIALDEISVTGTPAVANTWLANITKSVTDWKEPSMKIMHTLDTPEVRKTDAPAEQSTQPAPVAQATAPVAPPAAPDEPAAAPAEQPAQPVETPAEPSQGPVNGDTPDAPAPDTKTSPEVVEADKPTATEGEKTGANQPVVPAAAGEKDEAQPDTQAAKSAPHQASDDTSTVAKTAILGSWAEADLAESAVSDLAWNLQYTVWDVMTDTDKTPEERIAYVDAALAEFHKLILVVVTALAPNTEAAQTAAKAFKETAPDVLTKSLQEKDRKVSELATSVETTTTALAMAQKSLTSKEAELAVIQKALTDLQETHAQAAKDLEAAQKTIDIQQGRKTLAFNGGVTKAVLVDLEKAGIKANTELPKKLNGVY